MPALDPAQFTDSLISPKWVRGLFAGRFIVDSRRAVLARRAGRPPVYFFPRADIDMAALVESPTPPAEGNVRHSRYWDLRVAERRVRHAAWAYTEPVPRLPDLNDHIAFDWAGLDAWFEEDEQVFVHPRDPHVRVDCLRSSRHVQIVAGGEVVADSRSPVLLFETGLPVRYYLPPTHVRQELLAPSDHVTHCPYKGQAGYHSLRIHGRSLDNSVWHYRHPAHEAAAIAGLLCFYTERMEAVYIDGVPLQEGAQ